MTLDPQHVAEHNLMVANLHAQCARFGLTPTSGGPYTVGDPDHIGEHGRYLDDLLTIEMTAGRTFTKPIPNTNPVHGQTGHITDHEDLNAWIAEASTWPAFNDCTGGTVTEFNDGQYPLPGRWRVHSFTASGSLDISAAPKPFRVLVVAGGGASASNYGGGGGAGGMVTNDAQVLPTGAHTVTVGAGGAGGYVNGTAAKGSNSSIGGAVTATGGGGGGSQGATAGSGGSGGGASKGGTPGQGIAGQGHAGGLGEDAHSASGGGGGAGGPAPGQNTDAGAGKASDITGASVVYAPGGAGMTYGGTTFPNTGYGRGGYAEGREGGKGIVVVAYRIG